MDKSKWGSSDIDAAVDLVKNADQVPGRISVSVI